MEKKENANSAERERERREKTEDARSSLEAPKYPRGPFGFEEHRPLITGYTEAKQTYTPLASLVERTHEKKCKTKQGKKKRNNLATPLKGCKVKYDRY